MASTNIALSPFVTVGTKNDVLTNSANLSAALGVVVTNGTTAATITTDINTTDYVLTANTSGLPSFKVNPAAALASATVWTSDDQTSVLPGSIDIGTSISSTGLMKVTIASGVATPSRATAATTSAANDYVAGSTAGASLASLSGSTGGGVVLATLSSGHTVLSTSASTTDGQVLKIASSAVSWGFPAVRKIGSVSVAAGDSPTATITDSDIFTNTLVVPFYCGTTGTASAAVTGLPMVVDTITNGGAVLKVFGTVPSGGFTAYYMIVA